MAWHIAPVEQPFWISASGSVGDPTDIEKAPVIAIAGSTESRGNDLDLRYLVSDEDRGPLWVVASEVTSSGLPQLDTGSANTAAVDLLPIRKIGVSFVGAFITWAALQTGIDLPTESLDAAASSIVGLLLGYLVPDPRVVPASEAR